MSEINETNLIEWHDTCKCKCGFNSSVCNNKQRWNDDTCRCECKELIHKDVCDKGFIWNPSNCECECHKSCDFSEYLDHKTCKYKKRLSDKLVEECTKDINEVKIAEVTLTDNMAKCSSYIRYIVLFSITFTINVGISTYFVYYKYVFHKMFLDMIMSIKQQIININGKY